MIFFFDTETTGLPRNWQAPITDIDNWPHIVQIAYEIYTEDGRFYKKENFIIKPVGFIIPEESSKIHKISHEYALINGVEIGTVLNIIQKDISYCDIIVAHNIDFDFSVLACECYRNNRKNFLVDKRQICTMKNTLEFCQISSNYGYKWPTLKELHFKLFNEDFSDAHDASVDIEITIKCFWSLVEKNILVLNNNSVILNDILNSVSIGRELEESKKKTCRKCNFKYEKLEVYCNYCGTKMNPSKIDTFPSPYEDYYADNGISEIDLFVAKEMGGDAINEQSYYEAIEYFQKALDLTTEDSLFDKADALNGIGISYFKLNNFIEAEKYFINIKEIMPSFPFTYENLIATYYNLEDLEKMFIICETMPKNIEITASIWYYVGMANEKLGDLEISRNAFNKAVVGGMESCFEDLSRILLKISNTNKNE